MFIHTENGTSTSSFVVPCLSKGYETVVQVAGLNTCDKDGPSLRSHLQQEHVRAASYTAPKGIILLGKLPKALNVSRGIP